MFSLLLRSSTSQYTIVQLQTNKARGNKDHSRPSNVKKYEADESEINAMGSEDKIMVMASNPSCRCRKLLTASYG